MIAKIAFARQSLAAFADQVGRLGYDDHWILSSKLEKTGQLRPSQARHGGMHNDVFQQLTLALGHGLVEAQISITIPSEMNLMRQLSEADSASSDPSEDDGGDDEAWENEHYVLCPSFWRSDWRSCIRDWQNSTLLIDLKFVRVSQSNPYSALRSPTRPLFEAKPYLKQLEKQSQIGQVFIKQSELAIAHVTGTVSVFQSTDEDRYRGLNNRFIDELITVAWRQLAIDYIRGKRKRVKPRKFVRAMNDYISHLGIEHDGSGAAASTIAAICGKLNEQFTNRDIYSQPFVNSRSSGLKSLRARAKPE